MSVAVMSSFELFELSEKPLDVGRLAASLVDIHAGAFVSFEGRVRDTNENRAVVGLEYEAYVELCRKEGIAIVREARDGVIAARCVHRVGQLAVGDVAVWVGVLAGHRDEAFRAGRFIIDEVKRRVPIWKKEHYRDGSSEWIGLG
ncbi:MAG TPA: molybdenum cofactor biosynthesis protein MoaE [Spirochaetia bacterium]|nr:molybdenum cofactor biosynthesis protein MoaE [Spirochaetia bacterium]